MSISFGYRPTKGVTQFEHGTSSCKEKLERVFGDFPIRLGPGEIEKLMVLDALEPEQPLWQEIIDAVRRDEEITLVALY